MAVVEPLPLILLLPAAPPLKKPLLLVLLWPNRVENSLFIWLFKLKSILLLFELVARTRPLQHSFDSLKKKIRLII